MKDRYFLLFLLVLIILSTLWGCFVHLMEPDSVTYALVSMEMFNSGNYTDITLKGMDWLDKPHFQFWISAFSYHLFGINDFAFKIPSILIFALGVYYTFLFGKRFYSREHGILAAAILASATHIFLSNNDVRAEPILTGFTMMAMYHMAVFLDQRQWKHLLLSCLAMGFLMMTKGLFTILPVAGAVFFSLLIAKNWKGIFHWQWLATGLLVAIFTLPSVISYYLQFDLHPEKEVFGEKGVSGVKFFFWDSQWGRFTNSGPIKGQGDPTFFLHTLLWAFAPWAFFFYHGLLVKIRNLFNGSNTRENYSFFGFLFFFLILSASSFQLPHYLNQVFPFMALITAESILSAAAGLRSKKIYRSISTIQAFIFLMLIGLLSYFFLGRAPSWDTWLILIASFSAMAWLNSIRTWNARIIVLFSGISIASTFYFINRDFYPVLLKYQSDSEVVFYMNEQNLPTDQLVTFDRLKWAPDFYAKQIVPEYYREDEDFSLSLLTNRYVFTGEEGYAYLKSTMPDCELIREFQDFHVTTLNGTFINRRTRNKATSHSYLIKIN